MNKQNVLYKINIKDRGFRANQEVFFDMKAHAPLTPAQRRQLTNQTGQILSALGSLLANPSISDNPASTRTGRNLLSLGRKLIDAGSDCNEF
jgi:hypothetical protein